MNILEYISRLHITEEYTGIPPSRARPSVDINRGIYWLYIYNSYFDCLPEWGASKIGHTTMHIVLTQQDKSTKMHSLHTTIHSFHTKIRIVFTQGHNKINNSIICTASLPVPPPSPDPLMFRTLLTKSRPVNEEGRLKT
jgi:hypothetical protein